MHRYERYMTQAHHDRGHSDTRKPTHMANGVEHHKPKPATEYQLQQLVAKHGGKREN